MKRFLFIAWSLAVSTIGLAQERMVPQVPEDSVRMLCEYMVRVYPQATLQDLYKTCYQDFFGAEHMISDTTVARLYLHHEYMKALVLSTQTDLSSLPYLELTGFRHRFKRIYLYYDWDQMGISEDIIFHAFLEASKAEPVHEYWEEEWLQIESVALQVHPEWRNEELQTLLRQAAHNNQAVHHSDAYHDAYHPHYRIIVNHDL